LVQHRRALTRQALINDDMGFFTDVLTVGTRPRRESCQSRVDVYAALLAQTPAILARRWATRNPLFDAAHSNISTNGTAIVGGRHRCRPRRRWRSRRTRTATTTSINRPDDAACFSVGLGGQARVINQSQYDPDTRREQVADEAEHRPSGCFSQIVDTPRLDGQHASLSVRGSVRCRARASRSSILDGQERRRCSSRKDGFRVDGMRMARAPRLRHRRDRLARRAHQRWLIPQHHIRLTQRLA
jgi:hypothetical protein